MVGGLKCYLIAGLVLDSGISRKSGQMPAFVQGFWQSHDLYSQSQGQKVLASSVPYPFRGGIAAEWEGCSGLGAV